ncbi:MAG: hypothetical protein FJY74_07685 [Candidatus Eisenbacteria bacterium]|nr:hypothetical protein [Candidatus Eisenbacteria bacterium]
MRSFIWILVMLAAVAFVLAVVSVFFGPIMGVWPEGFSRASGNIALIAIALALLWDRSKP